ncbi:HK97 family phage prohead protease [Streptomyces sp. 3214.6]|uniref:HK97 family phage prohead protease n=1 Tax=Streptomyces sp. 3214.6 TaxID=1882757 RepID=UPI000909770E|nr:HK97 family phage prohead protease [Streptomyces sp. 3214.6]SHI68071.1 phage prohead protease, HK97 family [Streptomyces sp. 3214.6]
MVDRRQLRDSPERRGIASGQFELRTQGGQLLLTGYASVFNSPYDVYGGPPMGWTEDVDPHAFDVTLGARADAHLLINHGGMPLARTKSGTLKLATDTTGLHVEAGLEPSDPDVQRLMPKMNRRDMDEMSFGFRVKNDEWNEDYTQRRLLEVSLHKGDVSVVNFGANPATSAQLNSASDALELLAKLDPEAAMAELRSDGVDLERIIRARDNVLALQRQMKPQPKAPGRLSLAEARAIADGEVEVRLAVQIPSHSTAVTDDPLDRRAAVAGGNQVVLRYMHAWVDPDSDPEAASSYRFPHHEPRIGSPASLPAVRHALSLLPQAAMPDEQKAAVERHLRRHLEDAD